MPGTGITEQYIFSIISYPYLKDSYKPMKKNTNTPMNEIMSKGEKQTIHKRGNTVANNMTRC